MTQTLHFDLCSALAWHKFADLARKLASCRKAFQLSAAILILISCLASVGCTPKIPTRVTAEEMDVYGEWLKHHFANRAPDHLYIDDQTFVYDPLDRRRFGDPRNADNGIPSRLLKEFHALGNAEYHLEVGPRVWNLPWPYQTLNARDVPTGTPTSLHIIAFSRVAFNRGHTEALFAISDSCGGECGGGGPVHARKENGKWTFTDIPGWIY